MKINSSLDWNSVQITLTNRCRGLIHEKQIKKMIHNISDQVSKLSGAEVEARRGKKHRAEELLNQINSDIELVEEYIIVARLLN